MSASAETLRQSILSPTFDVLIAPVFYNGPGEDLGPISKVLIIT